MRVGPFKLAVFGCLMCLLLASGCVQESARVGLPPGVPIVRVRLQQDLREVRIAASEPALVRAGSDMAAQPVNFPRSPGAAIILEGGVWKWKVGGGILGTGELIIQPGHEGTVLVNDRQYRGRFRLVPVSTGSFDLVNDVDVDGYLKGVLPAELYKSWDAETYRAQAIVARTYALYESRTIGAKRYWDVFPDQRSQVYGGIGVETSKSRDAVNATAGIVLAYGQPGQERIFKAYFSSCCGGISQSAYDAFGDPYTQPLSEQARGSECAASAKFNWGPVAVKKDELTRRFHLWAKNKSELTGRPRPELQMGQVVRIDGAFANKLGRPITFYVTDDRGLRYTLRAEELRSAINTDAGSGPVVYSGYFRTVDEPQQVRFVDGHGYGHGVGMCQWCAQAMAASGTPHEDIVLKSYPGARLVRAY
jgi:stage II sporulation protein D